MSFVSREVRIPSMINLFNRQNIFRKISELNGLSLEVNMLQQEELIGNADECSDDGKEYDEENSEEETFSDSQVVFRMKQVIRSKLFTVDDKFNVIDQVLNGIFGCLKDSDGERYFKLAAEELLEEESLLSSDKTDNDKLTEVFSLLESEHNIICRQNYDQTLSGASHCIYEEMETIHEDALGYVFYHNQDTERAMACGLLWLAFGTNPDKEDTDAAGVRVGKLLQEALNNAGLRTQWNGTTRERVTVHLKWDRRIGALLTECLKFEIPEFASTSADLLPKADGDEMSGSESWEDEEDDVSHMVEAILNGLWDPSDKFKVMDQMAKENRLDLADEELSMLFKEAAERIIEKEKRAAGEPLTDNQKLDQAFAELTQQGILCRHNYERDLFGGTCRLYDEMEVEHKEALGYVFYSSQDTERAMRHGLSLSFGSNPDKDDTDAAGVRVGKLLQDALTNAGLRPHWSGRIREQVTVFLNWDRRIAGLLTECLASNLSRELPAMVEVDNEVDDNEEYCVGFMVEAIINGLWNPSDKFDVMYNMAEEADADLTDEDLAVIFKKAAERIIDMEKRDADEVLTDNQRLDQAFAELTQQGILCRHNYDHTLSGASHEIRLEMKNDHRDCEGCVFYHSQDVKTAREARHLFLAFTSNPLKDKTEAGVLRVGQRICDALRANGLNVKWDQSTKSRIDIQPFGWYRRLSELLKMCLDE